ncbi:MAG: HPr kinase/phosphorylase [Dongiaceae bacterium]
MAEAPAVCFLQATCVAIDGAGVLIRGPSGSGKSDLARRLIDGGALLVADDGVELRRVGDSIAARFPPDGAPECRGRLEVRGLGIVAVPCSDSARLDLVVDLVSGAPVERLPEPAAAELLDIAVPAIRLDGFEASAPAKVRLAVRARSGFIIPPP